MSHSLFNRKRGDKKIVSPLKRKKKKKGKIYCQWTENVKREMTQECVVVVVVLEKRREEKRQEEVFWSHYEELNQGVCSFVCFVESHETFGTRQRHLLNQSCGWVGGSERREGGDETMCRYCTYVTQWHLSRSKPYPPLPKKSVQLPPKISRHNQPNASSVWLVMHRDYWKQLYTIQYV